MQNETLLLKVSGQNDTRHRIRSVRGMKAGVISIAMTPSDTPGVISAISVHFFLKHSNAIILIDEVKQLRSHRNDSRRQDEITFEHYAAEPTKVQTLNAYYNSPGIQRDVFRSHQESVNYAQAPHTFTIAFSESSTV